MRPRAALYITTKKGDCQVLRPFSHPFRIMCKQNYSALLAWYMILSAEHLLSSCLTSVMIPILTSMSPLMTVVIHCLSASLIASRYAAMKSRISSVVLKESLSWIRASVPY